MIMAQDRAQFCNWGHIPNKPQKQLENHNIQHVAVATAALRMGCIHAVKQESKA